MPKMPKDKPHIFPIMTPISHHNKSLPPHLLIRFPNIKKTKEGIKIIPLGKKKESADKKNKRIILKCQGGIQRVVPVSREGGIRSST